MVYLRPIYHNKNIDRMLRTIHRSEFRRKKRFQYYLINFSLCLLCTMVNNMCCLTSQLKQKRIDFSVIDIVRVLLDMKGTNQNETQKLFRSQRERERARKDDFRQFITRHYRLKLLSICYLTLLVKSMTVERSVCDHGSCLKKINRTLEFYAFCFILHL